MLNFTFRDLPMDRRQSQTHAHDLEAVATKLLLRRRFLALSGAAVLPLVPSAALTQGAGGGPKLNLVLRSDLHGQGEKVQETVVNLLEMPAGASAPWHLHPSAQELLFVLEGSLLLEVEGQETKSVQVGAAALVPANIPHLARNGGASIARALVTHSRADKDKPLTVAVNR